MARPKRSAFLAHLASRHILQVKSNGAPQANGIRAPWKGVFEWRHGNVRLNAEVEVCVWMAIWRRALEWRRGSACLGGDVEMCV